jgi:prophage regulatory protein
VQSTNTQELTQQIFFITDLEKIIGRNRTTLRRWWLEGNFPTPIKLHGTTCAWHATVINQWIEKNLNPSQS